MYVSELFRREWRSAPLVWVFIVIALAEPLLGFGPSLTSLDRSAAPRSGRVIIAGSGFGAARNDGNVEIAGAPAHITRWMDTQIVAYVPESTPLGLQPVRVVTQSGASTTVTLNVTARPSGTGRVKWRFVADSDYFNHRPTVDVDGTIYAADLANLYALTPDGGLKWIYRAPGGAGYAPPAVGADGTVYLGTTTLVGSNWAGAIVAVRPDGSELWRFSQPPGSTGGLLAGPSIGPDGNIYAVTEIYGLGFFALSPTGRLLFSTGQFGERGNHGQEIVFTPSAAHFAVDTSLYKYSLGGTKLFQAPAAYPATQHQPAVGPGGNVYVHTFPIGVGLGLGAYTPKGALAWNFYEFPGNVQTHPDVGLDGTVYMGRNLSTLLALDGNGQVRWRYTDNARLFEQGPVVEPLNRFLVVPGRDGYGQPGFIFNIGTDGVPLWREYLPDENGAQDSGQVVASTRARFTPNGDTVYFGTNILGLDGFNAHSYLYALNASDVEPAPNTPPAVTLTSPTSGSAFTAPASVALSATASDAEGAVTKVQFYAGTTLIGEDTTAPYAMTWSNVAAGAHVLVAKATDAAGATATSNAIGVTVAAGVALKTLTATPAQLVGGKPVRVTIGLSAPAPPAGLTISLRSSNDSVLPVPASITVPAGASTAALLVTAAPVAGNTAVTLEANYGGVIRRSVVAVVPPSLTRLSLPASVTGGKGLKGTVTLNGPAPAGGVTAALSSAAPTLLTVPANVTIPAGATTASFNVQTVAVASNTPAVVTATNAGVHVTDTLTLLPPALASTVVAPRMVIGGASATLTMTLDVAAPAAGVTLALTSSSAGIAAVPATVQVPGGQRSVSVPVLTSRVAGPSAVTLSATARTTKSTTLTVTP